MLTCPFDSLACKRNRNFISTLSTNACLFRLLIRKIALFFICFQSALHLCNRKSISILNCVNIIGMFALSFKINSSQIILGFNILITIRIVTGRINYGNPTCFGSVNIILKIYENQTSFGRNNCRVTDTESFRFINTCAIQISLRCKLLQVPNLLNVTLALTLPLALSLHIDANYFIL